MPLSIKKYFVFGMLPIVLWAMPMQVFSAQMLDFTLPHLQEPGEKSLEEYQGKPVFMVFFEPDCSWCFRQMKAFKQLQDKCGDSLQSIAVGTNGEKDRLLKEVRRAKINYPSFIATAELIEAVGGEIPSTPWTLVSDSNGELITHFRGYHTLEKLQPLLPESCQSNLSVVK